MSNTLNLRELFTGKLDLSGWEAYGRRLENYVYGGIAVPGLDQEVFKKEIDGTVISVGVFYYNNIPVYLAWGPKADTHCSMHAPISPEKIIGEIQIGCPDVTPTKDGERVIGFSLQVGEKGALNF